MGFWGKRPPEQERRRNKRRRVLIPVENDRRKGKERRRSSQALPPEPGEPMLIPRPAPRGRPSSDLAPAAGPLPWETVAEPERGGQLAEPHAHRSDEPDAAPDEPSKTAARAPSSEGDVARRPLRPTRPSLRPPERESLSPRTSASASDPSAAADTPESSEPPATFHGAEPSAVPPHGGNGTLTSPSDPSALGADRGMGAGVTPMDAPPVDDADRDAEEPAAAGGSPERPSLDMPAHAALVEEELRFRRTPAPQADAAVPPAERDADVAPPAPADTDDPEDEHEGEVPPVDEHDTAEPAHDIDPMPANFGRWAQELLARGGAHHGPGAPEPPVSAAEGEADAAVSDHAEVGAGAPGSETVEAAPSDALPASRAARNTPAPDAHADAPAEPAHADRAPSPRGHPAAPRADTASAGAQDLRDEDSRSDQDDGDRAGTGPATEAALHDRRVGTTGPEATASAAHLVDLESPPTQLAVEWPSPLPHDQETRALAVDPARRAPGPPRRADSAPHAAAVVEEPSDRSEAGEDLVPDPSRFMVHPVPGETDEPKPRMVTVGTEEIMVTACVGVVATIYKAWRVDPEWGDHTVAEPMTRYLQIGHGLEDDPEAQFATAYRAILLAYPDLDPTSRRTDGEIITIDL